MADAGFSATTTITVDATKVTPTIKAAAPEIDKINELNRQNAERAAKDGAIRTNFARYKLGLTGKTFE